MYVKTRKALRVEFVFEIQAISIKSSISLINLQKFSRLKVVVNFSQAH